MDNCCCCRSSKSEEIERVWKKGRWNNPENKAVKEKKLRHIGAKDTMPIFFFGYTSLKQV